VLSVGNIGCGVQLPLPGCDPSLIQYDIAGPMSFDPSSILLVDPMFPSSTSQGWLGSSNDWHHRMSIPIAALPPAAQMWTWNAQVVLLDATAGCWMATKDSLQFWANQ
jgi:hypothetical protein